MQPDVTPFFTIATSSSGCAAAEVPAGHRAPVIARTEIAGGGRDDCALRGPYAELDKGLLLALRHAIEGLKKAHCPQYARRWRGTIGPGRSVRRLLPAGWSSRLRWRPTVSPARPGSDRLSGAKNWLAT
jgi:hypothetical protein